MYVNIYEEKWLFVRIGETNDKLFLESYGIWNRKHTKKKTKMYTKPKTTTNPCELWLVTEKNFALGLLGCWENDRIGRKNPNCDSSLIQFSLYWSVFD